MARISFSAFHRTIVSPLLLPAVLGLLASCILSEAGAASPGEEAFRKHCFVCHVKGGNVITPSKPLFRKDMEKSGIRTAADIIEKMRNPGPAMTKFDQATIPDQTAQAIAEYILNTFK